MNIGQIQYGLYLSSYLVIYIFSYLVNRIFSYPYTRYPFSYALKITTFEHNV